MDMTIADDAICVDDISVPDSWLCVDCGHNTAPGCFTRAQVKYQIDAAPKDVDISVTLGERTPEDEIYMVHRQLWKQAGMQPWGGCLCIGCLEARLGRRLQPFDFPNHPLNWVPGSVRLQMRRAGASIIEQSPALNRAERRAARRGHKHARLCEQHYAEVTFTLGAKT
jgi:hypothetical protein